MKQLIGIILLSTFVLSCGISRVFAQDNITRKKVFLFAGQSNMEGRADGAQLSEEDRQRLHKISNRIQFYYNHQPVTPLQLTTPKNYIKRKFDLNESFGPELFFGIELAEKYPDEEFIFIKRSKGGTSLYGCWNPDWTEEKAKLVNELDQPQLYSDFVNYVKSVLGGYGPDDYEIKGMLWVQGETDSAVKKWGEEPARTYGKNLRKLIKRTRAELGCPQMPFVMFQVGGGKVVDGMQETAENDRNVYLIPQSKDRESDDFYERNPPPIGHYTANSMKKIGVGFFKVFDDILNEQNKNCNPHF